MDGGANNNLGSYKLTTKDYANAGKSAT
jgi:hypothetical protein